MRIRLRTEHLDPHEFGEVTVEAADYDTGYRDALALVPDGWDAIAVMVDRDI